MITKKDLQHCYNESVENHAMTVIVSFIVSCIGVFLLDIKYQIPVLVTFLFISILAYFSIRAMVMINILFHEIEGFTFKRYASSRQGYLEENIVQIFVLPLGLVYLWLGTKQLVVLTSFSYSIFLLVGCLLITGMLLPLLIACTRIRDLIYQKCATYEVKEVNDQTTRKKRATGEFAEELHTLRASQSTIQDVEQQHILEVNIERLETSLKWYDQLSDDTKTSVRPQYNATIASINEQIRQIQQAQEQQLVVEIQKNFDLIEKNTPL